MLKMYKHILDIDNLGNRVFTKILFTFLFLIRVVFNFFPLGDPDFYPLYKWSQDALSNPDMLMNATISDMPITLGNIVFIISSLFIDFLMIMGALTYCGAYIRNYRKKIAEVNKAFGKMVISNSRLTGRILLMGLIIVFLFVPISIFVLYLPIIFIIIFPCLIVYVACYLSGDKGIFASIPETVKRTRGFYLLIARDLSTIMLCYFLLDYLLAMIGDKIPVVTYVVAPFAVAYIFLVIGRYAGFIYCRIHEAPLFIVRRPGKQ